MPNTRTNLLPIEVKPRRLADQMKHMEGSLGADRLNRLTDVGGLPGPLHVVVDFDRDEQRRPRIKGQVEGSMTLQCQRCLGDVEVDVGHLFDLLVVWDLEQLKALPRDSDGMIVPEEEMLLAELIEEQVLLQLPTVALHPVGDCEAFELNEQEEIPVSASQKPNPFNVLADLLKK
jgi:uncharacterized protein